MRFTEISAHELDSYLKTATNKPLLLDVREPWEFDKCKIEHSILVPMRQIPNYLNELDPDRETIVICHHGIRSRAVASYLANQDFSQVINLTGGIDAWAKSIDLSMETY